MSRSVPTRRQMLANFASDIVDNSGARSTESSFNHLERSEAQEWLRAGGLDDDPAIVFAGALDTPFPARRLQLNALLIELMGDISADKLIELRDVLRRLVLEEIATDVREKITPFIDAQIASRGLGMTQAEADRERGVYSHGDPLTGR